MPRYWPLCARACKIARVEPHEIIAAAVGTTTLCGVAYRLVLAPVISHAKASLAAHEAVIKEFRPNGGNSMRDAINDIRQHVHRLMQVDHIAMEMSSRAYIETDEFGACVWVNNAYLDMVGMHRDDVLGMGWVNAIHPSYRDGVRREWDSCIADARSFRMKFRIASNDVCVLGTALMIKKPCGGVSGAIASVIPVECGQCERGWRDELCSS